MRNCYLESLAYRRHPTGPDYLSDCSVCPSSHQKNPRSAQILDWSCDGRLSTVSFICCMHELARPIGHLQKTWDLIMLPVSFRHSSHFLNPAIRRPALDYNDMIIIPLKTQFDNINPSRSTSLSSSSSPSVGNKEGRYRIRQQALFPPFPVTTTLVASSTMPARDPAASPHLLTGTTPSASGFSGMSALGHGHGPVLPTHAVHRVPSASSSGFAAHSTSRRPDTSPEGSRGRDRDRRDSSRETRSSDRRVSTPDLNPGFMGKILRRLSTSTDVPHHEEAVDDTSDGAVEEEE